MERVQNSQHLKYGYKKAHILPRHIDICKTVNIWNIGMKNWTYYINPFTEHVPNSKHLKYGYKKAQIFPLTQGYMQNSEHLKSWYINLNILYSPLHRTCTKK